MKDIEFICEDQSIIDNFPVKPASKVIPDWYKNLDMWKTGPGLNVPTIKHCIPAQDMITTGYIIHNTYETKLTPKKFTNPEEPVAEVNNKNYIGFHNFLQLPEAHNGKQKHYIKIKQPWRIKTPKGYSCLFIQPFYHFESRYRLFPAIVDTDVHDLAVNLPGILLTDEEITLEPNDPIMQVIPFKREDWQIAMRVKERKTSGLEYFLNAGYRRLFHFKKKFK